MINPLEKIFIVSFLFMAMILTVKCPCSIILSCHINNFYFFILVPLFYVILRNNCK